MTALPVIVGMGGINAAGRTSFHQGFRRIVIDKLNAEARQETFVGLATLMNLLTFNDGQLHDQQGNIVAASEVEARFGEQILAGTLIRKIEADHFDPDATPWQQKLVMQATDNAICFETRARDLPSPLPRSWQVTELEDKRVRVEIAGEVEVTHAATRDNPIKAAGQFPTGFNPAVLYNSRYQPRGLQATIFGAADAIHSTGYSWQQIASHVSPDEIGTYSASVFGQVQSEGHGGMMQNRLRGERVSTKNLALGLNTMSTDFINAYVTGSVGTTFTSTGACATFLYNLKAAVQDIQAGRIRLAIVGSNDCAVTPEVIEGFGNMSALANEEGLKKLDGITEGEANHRKTSRPFGENCGFTIGEAAQFVVLMDDSLAVELGAKVLGSVADVYTNADGIKKSITAPGPGNYITMAKSVALAKSVLGEDAVQKRSFILAHGSSTPQNRVTESLIYHRVAESFAINDWPVAAPKAYLGHTIGPASGDQLAWALGVFEYNIMPGITTIDNVADDVYSERLNIATDHWRCQAMDVAFINSKGFGGNNATATVFSPKVTLAMMEKRHGEQAFAAYQDKLATVEHAQQTYQTKADNAQFELIYKFGDGVLSDEDIELTANDIAMTGLTHKITLPSKNPFADMV
ncbi:beta-ketoacyl-[acyl-carrier-protein] synthase FabY [Thalassotalea insulae]|uniref:Beta-ketoacyl-[acyl-carrier-protein] synthase FabY n=1 Tax=Thalassotalea insulae TaxID=2056778 RepID=A0ABQ6GPQ0_9GAMM|nr:beta-ketoacyl synthase [Thalassotalea insulae]GLX77958.1 beta-ketoacyl-[acyl-carrier-protein] synthase FabY [Thalassotalea insulae]